MLIKALEKEKRENFAFSLAAGKINMYFCPGGWVREKKKKSRNRKKIRVAMVHKRKDRKTKAEENEKSFA